MALSSDFIREDVELDENWRPKERSAGMRAGGGRPAAWPGLADALASLWTMVSPLLFLVSRGAMVLFVFYVAFRSLRPHGGFRDCVLWLCVAGLLASRIKDQMLRRFERDRNHAERN